MGITPLLSMDRAAAVKCVEEFVRRERTKHEDKCTLDDPLVSCPGSMSFVCAPCRNAPLQEQGHKVFVQKRRPVSLTKSRVAAAMRQNHGLFNGKYRIMAGVPVCRFVPDRIDRVRPDEGTREFRYCIKVRSKSGRTPTTPLAGFTTSGHQQRTTR